MCTCPFWPPSAPVHSCLWWCLPSPEAAVMSKHQASPPWISPQAQRRVRFIFSCNVVLRASVAPIASCPRWRGNWGQLCPVIPNSVPNQPIHRSCTYLSSCTVAWVYTTVGSCPFSRRSWRCSSAVAWSRYACQERASGGIYCSLGDCTSCSRAV